MSAPGILQVVLALVTGLAVGFAVYGWWRLWSALLVNTSISSAFLGLFWMVTTFHDFETSLSETGRAILAGVAVAGIAEFASALRILLEQKPQSWIRR